MTFREVEAACKGYEVRLARSQELERFIASVLINANRKKGARVVRPEDIMSLVTDRKAKRVTLMSKDEYEKVKEMFSKVEWQKKN